MGVKLVELHLHLDGAVRHETILDLAKRKHILTPDLGSTAEAVRKRLVHASPCADLPAFLEPFTLFYHLLAGDLEAIERVAYELCETQAKNNVVYFETRYCPHLLATTSADTEVNHSAQGAKVVTPEQVLQAVNRGLAKGQKDHNIMARSILVGFNGKLDIFEDMLKLCQKYRSEGVVGIDIAQIGSAEFIGEIPQTTDEMRIFQRAKELGIHRTVHAGEAGDAGCVQEAIDKFHAERIGHGYHVLDDEAIYAKARDQGIHFEACPWSSYLTGSVKSPWKEHPIARFMADGANFGLSTDDPTVTGNYIGDEVALVQKELGWTDEQIKLLQINAAKASFLTDEEKKEVIKKLES